MPKSAKDTAEQMDTAEPMDTGGASIGAKKQRTMKAKKSKTQSFHVYINKTLKQVHPEVGMKKASMEVLDSMVRDLLDKVASEASVLHKKGGGATISERDVKTAVRLLFPGDLSKHAIQEADKALAALTTNDGDE